MSLENLFVLKRCAICDCQASGWLYYYQSNYLIMELSQRFWFALRDIKEIARLR